MFLVTAGIRSRCIKGFQRFTGLVADRPAGTLHFPGLAAIVAGAADLLGNPHRQLGRVDYGIAFFKHGGFGQSRMPGASAVAGFTGDARLVEGLFFQIHTGRVAATALQQPGTLVPVIFMIIYPAMGLCVVLNR